MNAKRFFEKALPQMAIRSFHDFLEQQGSISFDIEGEGQWTFTFGTDECVVPGLKPDADLKLKFKPKAFAAFVDGTLDAVAAVQAKEISVRGKDFTLLEVFGRVLRPPSKNDLGWEVQTQH